MSNSSNLSAKQAKFVQEFLVDGNGTQAAIRSKFGVAGARVTACRLLTNPNVQKALQARQTADATRLCLAREDVLAGLLEAVAQAKEQRNPMAMISGWREIGKMMGYFAPGRINLDVDIVSMAQRDRLERMTDSELLKIIGDFRPDETDPSISLARI
jgi:hypothetical protein